MGVHAPRTARRRVILHRPFLRGLLTPSQTTRTRPQTAAAAAHPSRPRHVHDSLHPPRGRHRPFHAQLIGHAPCAGRPPCHPAQGRCELGRCIRRKANIPLRPSSSWRSGCTLVEFPPFPRKPAILYRGHQEAIRHRAIPSRTELHILRRGLVSDHRRLLVLQYRLASRHRAQIRAYGFARRVSTGHLCYPSYRSSDWSCMA